jgi:hypothetical protein
MKTVSRGGYEEKMTKKIRMIRTTIVEYEPIAEYYPDCNTIEDMAVFDSNMDDREALFSECLSDNVKWEIIKTEE